MAGPEQSRQPTVLVFDDEDDLRDVMCRMLQRRGFTTLSSSDPDEALAVCRAHDGEIDVLLADLGMPDGIGATLAERAVRIRPGMRVLFVSGMTKEAALRQGVVVADAEVLEKPFTSDGLVSAVRQALPATSPG